MKKIKYQTIGYVWECEEKAQILIDTEMPYSETNEKIAKREAYNGEYTIEDDGQPEPEYEPTAEEILNAMLGVNRYA